MSVKIVSDMQILQEVNQILMSQLSPAKLVRFWAMWQNGSGDYLAWRDEVFGESTVMQLYEKIEKYQTEPQPAD